MTVIFNCYPARPAHRSGSDGVVCNLLIPQLAVSASGTGASGWFLYTVRAIMRLPFRFRNLFLRACSKSRLAVGRVPAEPFGRIALPLPSKLGRSLALPLDDFSNTLLAFPDRFFSSKPYLFSSQVGRRSCGAWLGWRIRHLTTAVLGSPFSDRWRPKQTAEEPWSSAARQEPRPIGYCIVTAKSRRLLRQQSGVHRDGSRNGNPRHRSALGAQVHEVQRQIRLPRFLMVPGETVADGDGPAIRRKRDLVEHPVHFVAGTGHAFKFPLLPGP